LFSDGQRWDATFIPTLSVTEHGVTTVGPILPANFTVAGNFAPDPAPNDGTTTTTFRVSNELISRGQDGKLLGGAVPNLGTGGPPPNSTPALFGGTVGTLVFRTIIQENFSDTFPSGDASVDQGDVLTNGVTIAGDLLSVADVSTPTGFSEADTSAASAQIVTGALTKSVYAINGSTVFSSPPTVAAGDTVTYRLRYTLPTSDVEDMRFRDFLPLPIFLASEVLGFVDVVSAAAPAAGTAKFGPADTFRVYSGIVPTLNVEPVSNALTWDYGSFDSPLNQPTEVDLLFTVTATAVPFADGLFLTNQANYSEGSTNGSGNDLNAIVQVQITEPVLNVRKGVVSTDKAGATFSPGTVGPVAFNAPGTAGSRFAGTIQSTNLAASPINSDLSGVDAGDRVTFALVIENTGSGLHGGFDVSLRDTLPAGFAIPGGGLNLRVVDGTGAVRPFTTLGTGLFDPSGGIRLDDPGATGAIAPYHATNGQNVIVITYDLQLTSAVQAGQVITNTVTLFHYASDEAGPDFTTTDLTDTATVALRTMNPIKSIVSTSESHTGPVSGTQRVAIGEIIRYRLVSRLPEGSSTNVRFVDQLPSGLQYLNDGTTTVVFVSNFLTIHSTTLAGPGLAVFGNESTVGSITPTFVMPGSAISGGPFGNGTDPTFHFGDLANSDNDADEEFIVLEFNALAFNSTAGSNDAGDNRNNNFLAQVNGSQSGSTSPNVQVVIAEPSITNLAHTVAPGTGDAGDTVGYTVTFSNGVGNDVTTAFDARLLVPLPPQLTLNLGGVNVMTSGGVTGVSNVSAGNTVEFTFGTIPAGAAVTITYTATINPGVSPGQSLSTPSTLTFTSLPGAGGTTVNPTGSATPGATGTDTGERDGSNVGQNDYRNSAPAVLTIDPIQPVKSIVSTSEAHTGFSGGVERVTIGEIVRFRFQVRIPEGTGMPTFQLVDLLPSGLTFLDDGTTTVAFVSNGAGVSSSTLAGAGLNQAGNAGNVGSILPTFLLPGAAISGGPFNTGVDPVFSLGDLTNADNDGDDEFVVLEFNALVDNSIVGSNDAGDDLINTYFVRINGSQSGLTSTPVTLRVVEPGLTINQSTSQPFADAGDVVALRIVVTNPIGPNATTAFEARILEALPPGLTLVPGSVVVTLLGGASGATDSTAGNTLDLLIAQIPAGGTVQIDFNAVLSTSLSPGQTIGGTAGVTHTSLPGPNGTTVNPTGSATPGATGANTGERDGSGGQNDYTAASLVTITIYEHAITGNVYVDADNDGVLDGGETPIQGVTVTLTGTDHLGNPVNLSTTTSAGGAYAFNQLRPGAYTVTETQPPGYLDGKDTAGSPFPGSASSTDTISGVVIAPGTPNTTGTGFNFGELRPASISGTVFEDVDNDGVLDAGENGIAGVTVTLTGTDDLGNPVNLSTSTGLGGSFVFDGLRPGVYNVNETQPSGYLDGLDSPGTTGGSAGNDVISNVTLTEGAAPTGVTFGELVPASLSGTVYHDADNDGLVDAGETGIIFVTVTLTGTDDLGNPVNLSTSTGIGGLYSFTNLRPGVYNVSGDQPSGYLDGKDTAGTAGGTAGNDLITSFVLSAGISATGYDFGELRPATLSGAVYVDADNDGVLDGGETGISGVTVTLTGTDDRGNPVNLSTSTGVGGAYSFT
ncbi:MAG: beta strand repeat-containing protein, partial [Isosphaeraceae bacterium]